MHIGRKIQTIFITFIIFAGAFYFSPIAKAQKLARAFDSDQISIKRDKEEMRKIRDQIKDTEGDVKRAQEAIRQSQEQEKELLRKMKSGQSSIEKEQDALRQQEIRELRQKIKQEAGRDSYGLYVFQNNLLKLLFIFSVMFLIYLVARMFTLEKKPPRKEEDNLLARVGDWDFFESDFKDCAVKIAKAVAPDILNTNNPNFKNNFIMDLMLSQILVQVAAKAKKGKGEDAAVMRDEGLFDLSRIEEHLNYLRQYQVSLWSQDRFYPSHYKGLFLLLLIANKEDEVKIIRLRKDYLSIKDFIEDKAGNTVISQEQITGYVDSFIADSALFLKTE